jgi:uncharacterized protein YjbI with pentapeptide repeats
MKQVIKDHLTGKVLYESKHKTVRECIEEAVKKGIALRNADFRNTDLRGADFSSADFSGAYFRGANLERADISCADLRGADLRGAYFSGADFSGANIDFSCWPLWCGSKNVKLDTCQKKQLLAHAFNVALDEFPGVLTQEQKDWLNGFHRIESGEFPKF